MSDDPGPAVTSGPDQPPPAEAVTSGSHVVGFTALHFAAQQGAIAAAEALLAAGARVDAVDSYGNTPLWTAVFNSRGRGELIKLLRDHGADPGHLNNNGQTPIGLARLIANYDVAQFFADLTDPTGSP